MPMSPKDEIARYLNSGEHDGHYAVWPGESFIARQRQYDGTPEIAWQGSALSRDG
jgi:hypothetical protein